jgi:benzoate-CoA ligase
MNITDSNFNFSKFIFEQSRLYPDKFAFIDDTETLTYKQLEERARGLACSLSSIGLLREDRVLISMSDTVNLPVAILGCILGGYIAVLTNPRTIKSLVKYYIEHSFCRVVLTDDIGINLINESIQETTHKPNHIIDLTKFKELSKPSNYDPPTTNKDASAYWLYTSGGTGEPKAAVHTHSAMYNMGFNLGIKTWQYNPDDIIYSAAKLFFAYGLCHSFECSLTAGSTAILMSKGPTTSNVTKLFATHKPTLFAAVPSFYSALIHSDFNLSKLSMRFCISAGEALPVSILKKWEATTGVPVYDLYGTTEFTGAILCNREGVKKLGTVGKPVFGFDCVIRDDLGNILGTEEVGNLYIKGPSMATHYHNDVEKTRKTFIGEWCYSGDQFKQDSDGYFTFIGRSNEMFKIQGNWIAPLEIENVILQHDLVQEVGVTSLLDQDGLSYSVACITLKPGIDPPENIIHSVKSLIRHKIEPFKCPKNIKIVENLPKNANGKIIRGKLKDFF